MTIQSDTKATNSRFKEDLDELGYFVFDLKDTRILTAARAKCIEIFNTICTFYGYGEIKNDEDIIKLYRSKSRPLWVAAYDQLRYIPEIGTLLNHPEIMVMVKSAGIRLPVWLLAPMLRVDMPNDDKFNFPIHQDFSYNYGSYNCITLWMPLQDVDETSGALWVIPESHKLGFLPTENDLLKDYSPSKHGEFVQVPMSFGKILVFSQHLIHKSGSNYAKTVRFSLQIRYSDLKSEEYMKRKYYVHRRSRSLPNKIDLKFPEEAQ